MAKTPKSPPRGDRFAPLRIVCSPLPALFCAEHEGIRLGIQKGREVLLDGRTLDNADPASGLVFEAEVRVEPGKDGEPNFLGPFAHGTPQERFLYLAWGLEREGSHSGVDGFDLVRRLKLFLGPVERAGWSQQGITWELLEELDTAGLGSALEARVSGIGPDGTPHCGGTKVDWRLARQS
jgi:hypothetical protein